MILNIYTIHDLSAEESGPLFCAVNDAIAVRNVQQMLSNTPPHVLGDYQLLLVGEFDTSTSLIISMEPVEVDFMPGMRSAQKFYSNLSIEPGGRDENV